MKLLTYVVATSSADSSTNTTPPEFANPTRSQAHQGHCRRVVAVAALDERRLGGDAEARSKAVAIAPVREPREVDGAVVGVVAGLVRHEERTADGVVEELCLMLVGGDGFDHVVGTTERDLESLGERVRQRRG